MAGTSPKLCQTRTERNDYKTSDRVQQASAEILLCGESIPTNRFPLKAAATSFSVSKCARLKSAISVFVLDFVDCCAPTCARDLCIGGRVSRSMIIAASVYFRVFGQLWTTYILIKHPNIHT